MIPHAAEVIRMRWTVGVVVRVAGLLSVFATVFPLGSWFSEGLRDGDIFDIFYYMPQIFTTIVLGVFGIAVFLCAGLVSKLLVPLRRRTLCPKCGHDVTEPVEPRCTECGLVLSPEFMSGEAPDWHNDLRFAWREAVVIAVLRAISLPVALLGVLHAASTAYYMSYWGSESIPMIFWGFVALGVVSYFAGIILLLLHRSLPVAVTCLIASVVLGVAVAAMFIDINIGYIFVAMFSAGTWLFVATILFAWPERLTRLGSWYQHRMNAAPTHTPTTAPPPESPALRSTSPHQQPDGDQVGP